MAAKADPVCTSWQPHAEANGLLTLGYKNSHTKELSPEESRSLLTRLSSKLEKEDPDIVDTLSERLGYHPLALYLAGSYLNQRPSFSIQDFLSELGEREKGLAHSALTTWQKELGPTGHAPNILATFDMSWDQIEDTDEDKITKEIVIAAGYCAPNHSYSFIGLLSILQQRKK